jgi:hypothetical protein
MKLRIFRWKAVGPLLLFFLLLAVLVWIFAEPVARETTEEASTELLGTQVDLGKLDLLPRQASVDLRALQRADPFRLTRNLLEADEIRLKLNPGAGGKENRHRTPESAGEAVRHPAQNARPPTQRQGLHPPAFPSTAIWTKPLLSA